MGDNDIINSKADSGILSRKKMGVDERADFKLCSITVATTVFLWIPATLDVLLQNYPIEESIRP